MTTITLKVTSKDFGYTVSYLKKHGYTYDAATRTWSGDRNVGFLAIEKYVTVTRLGAVYPDWVHDLWKAGTIVELAEHFPEASAGTFFEWTDAGVGYDYPSFFCGDEAEFQKYQRGLIELAQARV